MRLRRFALGLLSITAAALSAALPAAGKEGVKATLRTSIPLDASAGTHLEVVWALAYADQDDERQPFGANGVFVRLLSAGGGGRAQTGFAPVGAYPTGEYAAAVVVPKGGIGDVEIGLRGWTSGPTGTRRGDLLFPITNDPVPGVGRAASPPSDQPVSERPGTGSTTWGAILVAASLSTLAVLAVVLLRIQRKRRNALAASRRRSRLDARSST